jgi:hypothetical protein
MKLALLALLGMVLGALGGAALGIGTGLAWIEIFKTSDFEGYSGTLVFFTFMPLGAMIGGFAGAMFFAVMALATPKSSSNASRCAIATNNQVTDRFASAFV